MDMYHMKYQYLVTARIVLECPHLCSHRLPGAPSSSYIARDDSDDDDDDDSIYDDDDNDV